jgi:hypothetical protein
MNFNNTMLNCPLCSWRLLMPVPFQNVKIAAAMGMSTKELRAILADSNVERFEEELLAHLSTHGPNDWVPALMNARHTLREIR